MRHPFERYARRPSHRRALTGRTLLRTGAVYLASPARTGRQPPALPRARWHLPRRAGFRGSPAAAKSHRQFHDRPPTPSPFLQYLAASRNCRATFLRARTDGRALGRCSLSATRGFAFDRRDRPFALRLSSRTWRSRNGVRPGTSERFEPRCSGGPKADPDVRYAVYTHVRHLADRPRSRCWRPLGATVCHGVPLHNQAAPWGNATPAYKRGRRQKVSGADATAALTLHDPVMILPQVHLRKPCYDFYFL